MEGLRGGWSVRAIWASVLVAALILGAGCNKLLGNRGETNDESGEAEKSVTVGGDKSPDPKPVSGAIESNFTGSWKTGWGPVVLAQEGTKLSGSYSGKFRGTLKGAVDGNEADVTWTQTNGEHGKALFTLSADGSSFKGTWGSGSSHTNGGSWNGTRSD